MKKFTTLRILIAAFTSLLSNYASAQANCKTYTVTYGDFGQCICTPEPGLDYSCNFGEAEGSQEKPFTDVPPPGYGGPITSVYFEVFGQCDATLDGNLNGFPIGTSTVTGTSCSCYESCPTPLHTVYTGHPPGYSVGGVNNIQIVSFEFSNSGEISCYNSVDVTVCYSSLSTVPTLGEWGLITFSMLLLSVCMVYMLGFRLSLGGFGSVYAGAGIPFDAPTYFKTLVAVLLVTSLCFSIFVNYFGYSLTDADVPGILINSPILAYAIHLWKMSKKN
ncbi:MAG: hypothetical protein HOP11_15245 [Saprospiraceae bacterium]|nr:hypothetical protein [Saprospiraceae bacterium]